MTMPGDRFDKFTERARKVLTLAQEEATRFNHNYIGTEHLLLGLVREGDGVAARVLANLGAELNRVRSAVEFKIGRGDRMIVGEIGLTPRARKVIELAVDEARQLGHHYIGTEHLLLGLVREGEGIAAGVLESLGVTMDALRTQTVQMLSQSGGTVPAAAQTVSASRTEPPVEVESLTEARTREAAAALPRQAIGGDGPRVMRIGLGCMGLSGTWKPEEVGPENRWRAITAFEAALEAGITLFDHADIYGGGSCEELFRDCLAAVPGSRERIVIATKGGIRSGHYNLSAPYLTECVERSLRRMGIDYIDLYQLHRPDPLTHPAETARALNTLLQRGLIRAVGVSNYYPEQVRALQRYLDVPLRCNQIEISLLRLDPLYEGWDGGDGTLDQCMAVGMTPLAWSPLGGGRLFGSRPAGEDQDERATRVRAELQAQAERHGATPVQVALAWLLAHPAGIIPLVGSADPAHIREAVGAVRVSLSREDWYALWTAAWGRRVP